MNLGPQMAKIRLDKEYMYRWNHVIGIQIGPFSLFYIYIPSNLNWNMLPTRPFEAWVKLYAYVCVLLVCLPHISKAHQTHTEELDNTVRLEQQLMEHRHRLEVEQCGLLAKLWYDHIMRLKTLQICHNFLNLNVDRKKRKIIIIQS